MVKYDVVGQATDGNLKWRFACSITKATDIHLEFGMLIAFHDSSGYANAPALYVYRYIAFLVYVLPKEDLTCTSDNVRQAPSVIT
jgi:hypothetical protein